MGLSLIWPKLLSIDSYSYIRACVIINTTSLRLIIQLQFVIWYKALSGRKCQGFTKGKIHSGPVYIQYRTEISDEAIENAVRRVLAGETTLKVAKSTGIPRTTLRRKAILVRNDTEINLTNSYKKVQVMNTKPRFLSRLLGNILRNVLRFDNKSNERISIPNCRVQQYQISKELGPR